MVLKLSSWQNLRLTAAFQAMIAGIRKGRLNNVTAPEELSVYLLVNYGYNSRRIKQCRSAIRFKIQLVIGSATTSGS